MSFLIFSLVCFRLNVLLVDEEGPFSLCVCTRGLWNKLPGIGGAIDCGYCFSVWICGALTALTALTGITILDLPQWTPTSTLLGLWLSSSGVVCLLYALSAYLKGSIEIQNATLDAMVPEGLEAPKELEG